MTLATHKHNILQTMGNLRKDLGKGTASIPAWWIQEVPHDTLYKEEDEKEAKRRYEEAMLFQRVPEEFKEKHGGEKFESWDPAENGPMGEEMEKEWENRGYKKDPETNKWSDEEGKPLEGRQFTIELPPGYNPGSHGSGGGGGGSSGGSGLRTPTGGYANQEGKGWRQPSWTTKKLKSTGNTPQKSNPEEKGMTDLEKAFAKRNEQKK
jgi:hypothetical protein